MAAVSCRICASDSMWHLYPFASRHAFEQIWQYHRSRVSPRAFIALLIALLYVSAVHVRCPCLGTAHVWWRQVEVCLRETC